MTMQWTHREVLVGFAAGLVAAVVFEQIRSRYYSSSHRSGRKPDAQSKADSALPGEAIRPAGVGIESTIGNTPLIEIRSLSAATGCTILAKCEFLNGAGNSPKDRVALSMIERGEAAGLLEPHSGDTVYEGTVGSTGISLATLCRARGYLAHICMPSDQSFEKSNLLLKLGAVVERVTPAPIVDQAHFVNRARNLAREHTADPNKKGRGYFANQFETEANWRAHYEGTGPEIYAQTEGQVDAFVAGAGTGGTLSGVAMFLKERLPQIKVVLADPQGSGLYNKIKHGVMFHSLEREGTRRRDQVDTIVEGIGLTRSTLNFEQGRELIDDAVKVTDGQAKNMARWLVERDGIFIGSSSAVNCTAALRTALELGPGHRVVTILCDSGARHLSKFWAQIGDIGGEARTTIDDILQGKSLN
ncbi:Cysteine synthase 2 [Exophiala dermatitidis]|uniref:Cysteine synthase 2 n=2 Tax=Exophiala dermatitidis TaxID=5970 RepID=H6C8V7_EXODN|nr:cysteine synthase [Exophiala dermatitidis NIH/UT8656]KAJ4523644.1 Cysteine synthase 2 [Exophiala dermatitidis]EHY60534.1 cysteine synthase [Exophiala dermatitidis NIH/UT8656]KAJ4527539.1 Cysteine synthase 2 [Exophiala dermatitidis]KAJ4531112.1 Cysteine synthase 2 [Exophiala dermatitidis]KAJ4558278.1 Cysteine synthase 2 [Exophiala dermatitidis]